jgi:hypothetical protein
MSEWTVIVDGYAVCVENNISEEVNVFLQVLELKHGATVLTVREFVAPDDAGVVLYYEPALYGASQLARLIELRSQCKAPAIIYADNPATYDVTMKWAADMRVGKVLITVPDALEPHMLYEDIEVVPWMHACPFTPCKPDASGLQPPRQLTCVLFGHRDPVTHPKRAAFLQHRHPHTVVVPAPKYDGGQCTLYKDLQNVWADAAMVFIGDEPLGGLLPAHFEAAGAGTVILTSAKAVALLKSLNIHAEEHTNGSLRMRLPDHREVANMESIRNHHQVWMRARDLHDMVKAVKITSSFGSGLE